jgi:hypothetical protein
LATAPPALAAGHPAGLIGSTFGIPGFSNAQQLSYDVAARSNGTAYIGWISRVAPDSGRKVHLCTLPSGSTSCTNGVQTISAIDGSSAAGLNVVVTADDVVHLIWFHDTVNSINGAHFSAIAQATALHGLNLSAGADVVTNAPSFGSLLDAEVGPGGAIWTVTYPSGLPTNVEIRRGISAAADPPLTTPYGVGGAQLAFTGGNAVLAVQKYGSISTSTRWAMRPSSGPWGSFHTLAHTWNNGGAMMKTTGHGLRIVTGVDNASYRPVIARWTGTTFGPRTLTSDTNSCGPSSHDGRADPSGRLLDVSWECNDVTVTNYADAFTAAITRFRVGNTPTYTPQIASGTRGIATVVFTVLAPVGSALRVAHVRLPDSTHTVAKTGTGGRVTVTGPRSCLPPVNVHVGWTHAAASGWTFKSGALHLGGNVFSGSTLDGATLTPNKTYTLTATARFGRNGTTSTVQASLAFKTCATA